MDKLDHRILYELDLNARQSNIQIGKKLKISKDVVKYRIERLLKQGIIKGFYAELDAYKMGYFSFRILLRLQNITIQTEKDIINYLVDDPKVAWVHSSEGNWDLLFAVWVKNIGEFYDYQQQYFNRFGKYVEKKMISIYHRMYIYKRDHLTRKTREIKSDMFMGNYDVVPMDDTDRKIINLILNDGRIPIYRISIKLKISPKIVTYRMKKLIKAGLILGFRPMLDLKSLGLSWFKIHILLKDINKNQRLALFTYIKSRSETVYIDEMIAGYDFEIDVELKDHIHLRKFVEDIRNKFSDIIKDFHTLDLYQQHKMLVWFPKDMPC